MSKTNISVVPESQINILEALQEFRFLTNPQMLRLEISKNKNSLSRILAKMKAGNRPKIKHIAFVSRNPNEGSLPYVYFLTKNGARILAEMYQCDLDGINYPKGQIQLYANDYKHRTATINFQIELFLFCKTHNVELDFFALYLKTTGANRGTSPEERLKRDSKVVLGTKNGKEWAFIPDGIFSLTSPKGDRFLFALEVYNGIDTRRAHNQLENHYEALCSGVISKQYNHPKGARILIVCETTGAMKALMKRLFDDENFREAKRFFWFSTAEFLQKNFFSEWFNMEGKKRNIFAS